MSGKNGKKMTAKNKRRNAVETDKRFLIVDVEHRAKGPNSYVRVSATWDNDNEIYEGIGFSKVSWPDVYDPLFGFELACKRALSDIADQILEVYPDAIPEPA